MVEESEKRFEALMNKLFDTPPKSKPDSNNARQEIQTLSGRKRPHSSALGTRLGCNALGESTNLLMVTDVSSQAPQCRPWDRSDLFRRLSTFKSMTWFAKPQVVSPLECARRGWVNIDVDTISCASCDARLLFSTPSAWTRQQVEKAAMVFSLKLDSGHKLLCPWINNICTEELAQFPILSPSNLIDDYKKRLFSLSHLSALPVVLPSSVGSLRSSQLEHFLRESSDYIPHEQSRAELPEYAPQPISSISYYQAQKMISLIGWEPHVLPYRVDFKDGNFLKDANVTLTAGEKQKVSIYSLCTSEDTQASSDMQFDHSRVVLDCKLCGASVGLWAFSAATRPLENLRFVGPTAVTGKNLSIQVSAQEGSSSSQMHIGNYEGLINTNTSTDSTSFGFTIAGGPPPAMLNYGATISLPIIGENLRARLPTGTEKEDHLAIQRASQMEEQHMLQEHEDVSGEGISAMQDSISKHLLDIHQTETGRTENTTFVDNRSDKNESDCSTDKNILVTPNERSERDTQKTTKARYYEHDHIGAEFDPVKQHRHFCPWIYSTGRFSPGWQQTLTALEKHSAVQNVNLSTVIEVDDPVASVEKLFTTSRKKGTNISGGS